MRYYCAGAISYRFTLAPSIGDSPPRLRYRSEFLQIAPSELIAYPGDPDFPISASPIRSHGDDDDISRDGQVKNLSTSAAIDVKATDLDWSEVATEVDGGGGCTIL